MRATVTDFVCVEMVVDDDVVSDPHDVDFLVEFWVRPEGVDGEDMFSLSVVSIRALAAQIAENGPAFGRHLLIVDRWDWERVQHVLTERVAAEEAETWEELAGRIGRWAKWEFEDHVEPDATASEEELRLLRELGIDVGDDPPEGRR